MSKTQTEAKVALATQANNAFKTLWIEKHRPRTLAETQLPDDVRSYVEDCKKDGEIANLLLYGKSGLGKTTLAKAIVRDVFNCSYLYINASDENGIDTIRTKVVSFAETLSLDGGIKIIILDECDGLTMEAQRALRNSMEKYAKYCRFIITCNYKNRIIPALQSRCTPLDVRISKEQFIDQLEHITTAEELDYSRDQLVTFSDGFYPDMRSAINTLQYAHRSNQSLTTVRPSADTVVKTIVAYLAKGRALEIRTFVIENEENFGGDYADLLRQLFNMTYDLNLEASRKLQWLLIIGEHLQNAATTLDQEINFYSCMIKLCQTK